MRTTGPRAALTRKLDDPKADEVARNHAAAIDAINDHPVMQTRFVRGVVLKDGIETPIEHKLGRPVDYVTESCVKGAVTSGHIEEVDTGTLDRTKYVVLKAVGWGADITVTIAVA